MRGLVIAVCVAACGGGGNGSGPHNVTVNVVGPGSVVSTPVGIDCPGTGCTATFTDHVTLSADPNSGATFSGWSGGCTGTQVTCTMQLSSDQQVTAMFVDSSGGNQTLAVTVNGPGSVTATNIDCPSGACSTSYAKGTMVTLTETPQINATFSGWSGDCTGTGPCTVTMDQMRAVTATFAGTAGMHTLSVSVNGVGTVTSTPAGISCSSGTCTAMFSSSQTVTLQEQPGGGTFTGWSGDCSGNGSCSVAMSQDRSVTAGFGSSGYVFTVHIAGDGTGTVTSNPAGINCTSGSSTGCSYDFGPSVSSVSLTASPDSASSFAGMGMGGNTGCNGNNFGNPCSYPLGNSGTTVNVAFSGWRGAFMFPASLTGLALAGTTYVGVGAGGNAITSSGDATGGFGTYWTGRGAPAALNAVATLGATFYAAGDGGHVYASADGIAWTPYTAGTADLRGIAASGTTLVAVGKTGAIEYSTNGTMWNAATSGTTSQLEDVMFSGNLFVAVGFGGTILTSADGIAWTQRTSGVTSTLSAVAHGGSLYVAVGAGGVVVTSADAITWTKPTTSGLPVLALRGIAYAGTTFIAAGDLNGSNGNSYTSTDGVSWTAHGTAITDPTLRVAALADGTVYLLGASGSLQASPNGASWSIVLAPGGRGAPGQGASNLLYSIAYNGSLFVAGGQWGSIFTSPDGSVWTSRRAAPCCDFITGIAWGAGLTTPVFAAAGTVGGTMYVLTSPDGIAWTKVYPTTGSVPGYTAGIAYGGPTKGFAIVGSHFSGAAYQGSAITSLDGITWTTSATAGTDIASNISGLTYGNGLFVASGLTLDSGNINGDGSIYTSTDGAAWTAQPVTATLPLGAASYGNGTFVVLEPEGSAAWTSTNATAWTRGALGFSPGAALVFGNGVFYNSALFTSANGTTWTQTSALPDISEINGGVFTAAVYGGNQWIGVNSNEMFVRHP